MARLGHASKPKQQCPSKKPWHAALAWVVHELPRRTTLVRSPEIALEVPFAFFAEGFKTRGFQGNKVADVFGLKVKPSSDANFNTPMLPSRTERMISNKA